MDAGHKHNHDEAVKLVKGLDALVSKLEHEYPKEIQAAVHKLEAEHAKHAKH